MVALSFRVIAFGFVTEVIAAGSSTTYCANTVLKSPVK